MLNAASSAPAAAAAVAADFHRQYLTFALKGESYAVPIESVKEIIEFGALTAVPMMPNFVRGVMNLRGAVIPVLDLAVRFRQGETAIARRTCIVIFEARQPARADGEPEGRQTLGALVDAVHEVLDIAASDIEATPVVGTRIQNEFIRGMAKVKSKRGDGRAEPANADSRILIVLDLDRVLSIDELAQMASASVH